MTLDIFKKYAEYYTSVVTRPQPTDFVLYYFKNRPPGFFIDVGAHDGITWNNSIALSEILSWRGLCIEANPTLHATLQQNRPNDTCLNLGSFSSNGEMLFWQISGYAEMLSGFACEYNEPHVERINREVAEQGGKIKEVIVKTQRLSDTIRDFEVQNINYLSIDVEGSELAVLSGLDIDNNRPQLISIEDNGYTDGPHQYLVDNNYKFLTKVAGDKFYENSLL